MCILCLSTASVVAILVSQVATAGGAVSNSIGGVKPSTVMLAWGCLRWTFPAQRRLLINFSVLFVETESIIIKRNSSSRRTLPLGQAGFLAKNTFRGPEASELVETTNQGSHQLLDPPTTCCGSGCPNCVWVSYAEKLAEHYCDGGLEAERTIEREVTDPNLRAYILMEVRMKSKPKK